MITRLARSDLPVSSRSRAQIQRPAQRYISRPLVSHEHLARVCPVTCAQAENANTPYIGTDGRRKYTWEEAFTSRDDRDHDDQTDSSSDSSVPWSMGWQASERRMVLTKDLKSRLQQVELSPRDFSGLLCTDEFYSFEQLKRLVSERLNIPEEEAEACILELQTLMAGSKDVLLRLKPDLVAEMVQRLPEVAARMIALRAAFPTADVAKMVSQHPILLLAINPEGLEEVTPKLSAILPGIDVDRLVEQHPSVMDVKTFEQAVSEAKRLMPGKDVVELLRNNPNFILSLQRGSNLIPYDGVGDLPAP